jgi:hypothetical protein
MTDKQWNKVETAIIHGDSSRGSQCVYVCIMHNLSPLRYVRYSAFRPYGLVFWDRIRLGALGFPGETNLSRMFFAWSCILSEGNWEEISRQQAVTPRYDEADFDVYDPWLARSVAVSIPAHET